MRGIGIGRMLIIMFALAGTAAAQQTKQVQSTIAYISGATIYINAGRLADVVPGDTARVFRADTVIGSVVVTAIADSSSAAKVAAHLKPFAIGDAVVFRIPVKRKTHEASAIELSGARNSPASKSRSLPPSPRENVLSGRIALQYNMIAAEDAALNLSQPAAVVQMNVANLFGAGMALRIYGVSFLNGNGAYALFGNRAGLQNNFYQVSLTGETTAIPFGYGIGRLSSRFVSGLGTFDGAEAYYRISSFTAGVIGGAVPLVPSSTLGYAGTRTAAYLNYHSGTDIFRQYDGTAAYVQRMVGGKLDRNYLYLQNSLSLGSDMSFYESSEIDLSRLSNDRPATGLNFSNTFFSMNYFPVKWLFANIGYDAYRTVYLFQTMKSIPDSLIDTGILQGFRAAVTAYLPGSVTISADASMRTRPDYARTEHTVGGSVRSSDLLDLGLGASVRYMNLIGVYSNATDVTLELDRTFFEALDVTLSYESYDMTVSIVQQTYKTQTISGFLDYDFARDWYSTVGLDDIIDPTMNSFRLYTEIGLRF